jgi:flagellar basal-body rod modification protein FlgD
MNVGGNDTGAQIRQATTSLNNGFVRKSGEAKESLGKEDFLKLLMAQATHQDPLNPMDSQGMMNQLTQMGSLEQMINMNKQLTQLNQVQSDISQASAYSFLDRDVTVKGGRVTVSQGAAPSLQFQIPREAEAVTVQITDRTGASVRVLDIGAQGPGRHTVHWDGRDADNERVPDGLYQYEVLARSSENEPLPVETYTRGKVSSVRFDNGRNFLKVNGEEIDARSLVEISNQSQRTFAARQPMPLRESLQPIGAQVERKR